MFVVCCLIQTDIQKHSKLSLYFLKPLKNFGASKGERYILETRKFSKLPFNYCRKWKGDFIPISGFSSNSKKRHSSIIIVTIISVAMVSSQSLLYTAAPHLALIQSLTLGSAVQTSDKRKLRRLSIVYMQASCLFFKISEG